MRAIIALVRLVVLRHVSRSPLRALLTTLGVALGVAMVCGTAAANGAVLRAFDEMVDRAAGKADLEITGDESGVPQALLDEVTARADLVAHAAPRIEQPTFLEGKGGAPGDRVLVLGIDFLGDRAFLPFDKGEGLDALGDPLTLLNDPSAILVGDSFARAHGVAPDSEIKLRTAHGMETFRVAAVLTEKGKTRAFGGQVLVMFLDAAQLAFDRPQKVDRIDLALAPGVDVEAAKRELQAIAGARGTVDRPSRRAAQLARMTAAFRVGLDAVAAIAVLVGMFLVYNAVAIAVAQRRREIGLLRAVGALRANVTAIFVAEALVMGALGSVVGVLLGRGLARAVVRQFAPNVSRFFDPIATPEVAITPRIVATGIALGIGATFVAALRPARTAARVQPIEALARDVHGGARSRVPTRALLAAGVVIALAALPLARARGGGFFALVALFVGGACMTPAVLVAISAAAARIASRARLPSLLLGAENATRQLARSALAASALMLAAALSITTAAFTRSFEESAALWIDASLPSDLFVTAGSPTIDRHTVSFSSDWIDKVAAVPGVRRVNPFRTISVPYRDLRAELGAMDTTIFLSRIKERGGAHVLSKPETLAVDALNGDEPTILVSESFAWRAHVNVGDSIELPSPTGAHAFKIVGVIVDYSSPDGMLLVDRALLQRFWSEDRVEMLQVDVIPSADPAVVADAIRRTLDEGGAFVTSNAALKDEVRRIMQQTFGISKASEVVALLVAVFGVLATMLAQVTDRARELGTLRAIGAARGQIAASLAAEAAVLGLVAAIVGAAIAAPASYVFVKVLGFEATGWSVPFLFDGVAAARVALGLVVLAAASGAIPGFRAARHALERALSLE